MYAEAHDIICTREDKKCFPWQSHPRHLHRRHQLGALWLPGSGGASKARPRMVAPEPPPPGTWPFFWKATGSTCCLRPHLRHAVVTGLCYLFCAFSLPLRIAHTFAENYIYFYLLFILLTHEIAPFSMPVQNVIKN